MHMTRFWVIKVLIWSLFPLLINAYPLEQTDRDAVYNFITAFKNHDYNRLADLVSYPLQRANPIEPLRNKAALIERFSQIFDSKISTLIADSDLEKD